MNSQRQSGSLNVLLLPLLLAVLFLIGAVSFAAWAYGSRQDYKNNVDEKIAAAVVIAKKQEDQVKDAQFAEESKNPLTTYNGPSAYGSVVVKYPKTWSGYVLDDSNSDPYVDSYFSPGVVPDTQSDNSVFALRVQVSGDSYSSTMEQYQSSGGDSSAPTIQPYALPKVPKVVGAYVTGDLGDGTTGYMVVLPLRDKTLKIWTESDAFKSDLDNIILPNLTFSP